MTPAERGRSVRGEGRRLEGKFFTDITKVEGCRRPSELIPCLAQNSKVWSEFHKREALPVEHLVFQGFPAVPAVASAAGALPWAATVGMPPNDVSACEMRSLAGNAMHMGVLGAVMLFAFSSFDLHGERPLRLRKMTSLLEPCADNGGTETAPDGPGAE